MKTKVLVLIALLAVLYLINNLAANSVNVSFIPPTPVNATLLNSTNNSIYVNVSSASNVTNHSVFLDWNQSLVAWWNFESYNSTGLYDNSTYGFNGTFGAGFVTANISSVNGTRGNSGKFYGGSNVNVTDNAALSPANITVSAWVKPLGLPTPYNLAKIVEKLSSLNGYSLRLYNNGDTGKQVVRWRGDEWDLEVNYTTPSTVWTHIVATQTGTTASIYINGTLMRTGTVQAVANGLVNLLIGRGSGSATNDWFNGYIDEVMIFNRVLNQSEISALYNATASQYERNFTSLANGDYYFRGWGIDSSGAINSTELRWVNISNIVGGNTAPVFQWQQANFSNSTSYVTPLTGRFFSAWTDDNGTQQVVMTLNGTNYTMAVWNGTNTSGTWNVNITLTPATYYYNFTANDGSLATLSPTFELIVNDTSPPYFSGRVQSPSSLNTSVGSGINVSYNVSDLGTGVNASTVGLYVTVNNSFSTSVWKYVNGTAQPLWELFPMTNVSSENDTTSKFNVSLDDDDIYYQIDNYNQSVLEQTTQSGYLIVLGSPAKVRFLNFTALPNTRYQLEVSIMKVGAGTNTLDIWSCNSTYSSGDFQSSPACTQTNTIPSSNPVQHLSGNLTEHLFSFLSNAQGLIVGTPINLSATSNMSFIFHTNDVNSAQAWNLTYAAGSAFNSNSLETSTDGGTSWSPVSGSSSAQIHGFPLNGSDGLTYLGYACDNSGNCVNATPTFSQYSTTNFPPQVIEVVYPANGSVQTGVTNFTISAFDPNNDLYYLNMSICDNVSGVCYANFSNITTTSAGTFVTAFNTTQFANGVYYTMVNATDNNSASSSFNDSNHGDYFNISNVNNFAPVFVWGTNNFTNGSQYDGSRIRFYSNWTDDSGVTSVVLTLDNVNYTMAVWNGTNTSGVFNANASLGGGTHVYFFSASDGTLANQSQNFSLVIAKNSVWTFTHTINGSALDLVGSYPTTFAESCASNTFYALSVSVLRNGTIMASGNNPVYLETPAVGDYNLTCYSAGDANYSSKASQLFVNITKASWSISLTQNLSVQNLSGAYPLTTQLVCSSNATNTLNLTRNGTLVGTGAGVVYSETPYVASWAWNCSGGDENYSFLQANPLYSFITKNAMGVNVRLNGSALNQTYAQATTINASAWKNASESNLTLYRNTTSVDFDLNYVEESNQSRTNGETLNYTACSAESQNYTANCSTLFAFTLANDTAPPSFSGRTQVPPNLNATMTFLNVSYNITDAGVGVDNSTPRLYFTVNNTEFKDQCWYLVNGTCFYPNIWFLPLANQTGMKYNVSIPDEFNRFSIFNFNDTVMSSQTHSGFLVYKDNIAKVQVLNFTTAENMSVTIMFDLLKLGVNHAAIHGFACNSSYGSGVFSVSPIITAPAGCTAVAEIPYNDPIEEGQGTSLEHAFTFVISNGVIQGTPNNVTPTHNMSFVFVGHATNPNQAWNFSFLNGSSFNSNSAETSVDSGASWSPLVGTFDFHVHEIALNQSDGFSDWAFACDSNGNCANSSVNFQIYVSKNFPPVILEVLSPANGSVVNGTGLLSVSAFDPNNDLFYVNYSIVNNDTGVRYENFVNVTATGFGVFNTSFVSSNYPNGTYYVFVNATDNASASTTFNASEDDNYFMISNAPVSVPFVSSVSCSVLVSQSLNDDELLLQDSYSDWLWLLFLILGIVLGALIAGKRSQSVRANDGI